MSKLTRVRPGLYRNENGEALAVDMAHPLKCVRWLVKPANGKPSHFVPTLQRAREALA